jgi:chromosome segregation ATPase
MKTGYQMTQRDVAAAIAAGAYMGIEPPTMRDMLRSRIKSQMATIKDCKRQIARIEDEMSAAKQAVRKINQQISEIDKR